MKKFFLIFLIFIFIVLLCILFFILFSGKSLTSIFHTVTVKKTTEENMPVNETKNETFLDKELVLESVSLYNGDSAVENNLKNPDSFNTKSLETESQQHMNGYLIDDYQLLSNENNYELTFLKDNHTDISLLLPLPCVSSLIVFDDSYLVPLINGTILCFDLNKMPIKKIDVPLISKVSVSSDKLLVYGEDGFLYTYSLLNESGDFKGGETTQDNDSAMDLVYETILPSKEVFDKIIYSVSNFIDISQITYDKITEYGFTPLVNSQSLFTNSNPLCIYIAGISEPGEWTFTFFDEHGFKYDQWGLIGLYDLEGNQIACNVEYTAESASVTYSCSKGDIFYLVASLMGEEYPGDKLYIGTVKE